MSNNELQVDEWKERINYIKTEGVYVGYPVNIPACISQADTLEELESNLTTMVNLWVEMWQETMKKEQPFELKECTHEEWYKVKDR